ncbi:MAG: hypothetical protein L6V81_05225 [Clostridium sp.]|nr:MAG: hypothetical protein L6V81_05225 [Clostridium sp.]
MSKKKCFCKLFANNNIRGRLRYEKKYLIFTIALFLFCNVRAVTEKYSEWSSEYPKDINALLIKKEDRYLWYKDVITDEEFIMKEFVKDKNN